MSDYLSYLAKFVTSILYQNPHRQPPPLSFARGDLIHRTQTCNVVRQDLNPEIVIDEANNDNQKCIPMTLKLTKTTDIKNAVPNRLPVLLKDEPFELAE